MYSVFIHLLTLSVCIPVPLQSGRGSSADGDHVADAPHQHEEPAVLAVPDERLHTDTIVEHHHGGYYHLYMPDKSCGAFNWGEKTTCSPDLSQLYSENKITPTAFRCHFHHSLIHLLQDDLFVTEEGTRKQLSSHLYVCLYKTTCFHTKNI